MDDREDPERLLHDPDENVQEDGSLFGQKDTLPPRRWRRRIIVSGAILGLLLTAVVAKIEAPGFVGTDSAPTTTEVRAATTTTYSPAEIARQWYQDGAYMGYWAGNVETIPAESKHLPDFFFSGPTPSVPIIRDGEGKPLQEDPSAVNRPLWVFGDEVRVGDYVDRIRQAMKDGRPILFYVTRVADAVSALQLKQQVWTDTPLDRLIVEWLPWDNGRDGTVNTVSWNWDFGPPMIFRMLVSATLSLPREP